MPTYEYSCNDCGEKLEVVQSIHDDSLTVCPNCGGKLRKLFGNVGVVFKGSGFYKTDSRSAAKKSGAGKSSAGKESAAAPAKSEGKSESKPAAPAAGSASSSGSGASSSSSSKKD